MFISYFSRISQKYKEYYIDKSCLIETETSNIDEKTVEKDESKSNLNLDGDKIQLNLTQVSKKEEIFSEASIIESLSEFWFNFDYFWYLYGFYIILFMILMISFFKVKAGKIFNFREEKNSLYSQRKHCNLLDLKKI